MCPRLSLRPSIIKPRYDLTPCPPSWVQSTGVACTLHQLRHSHATELVNGGVSLATIRKRLGHQHIQTTLRYAEVSDSTMDAELRRWRRQQSK